MWRKPELRTERIDDLVDRIFAKAFSILPIPNLGGGGNPWSGCQLDIPVPADPTQCILERCTYWRTCDILPVF